MSEALWPYLLVILCGFLPTEIWRLLAVTLARGLADDSEILFWVRAVASALLAAVVAKVVLAPGGALAGVPLAGRLAALAAGLAGYYLVRRSVIAGLAVGQAVLVGIAWLG
ncbi:MAG TPA: AzlD domain-containing protein [Salinarimonas sp.]|jgi:branched-subunit amino acid transport protein|nr:AzlD domain-containing protein [Salinarimonas sp.]